MTLVSQAVFARMCKTTPKTVTKWKQEERLVMQGLLVDVEATEELMKRYRRKGSPIVLSATEVSKKGNARNKGSNNDGVTHLQGNDQIVTLSCTEILERLQLLDWTKEFDWSSEAVLQRARDAAKCIGWEAVESDTRDDGHWGGFQLRITKCVIDNVLKAGAIPAGHGYELSSIEVLYKVREEIEADFDLSDTMEVDLTLLPLLAHPFHELDRSHN
jgi:hypothetical protein